MAARVVALIPARAGSKRITGKNVRPLRGHPLVAYTITAALQSGVFADVVVSTDDRHTVEIAKHYGASAPFLRPAELASDQAPDITWVRHALAALRSTSTVDVFALLRPTSPLRLAATIADAVQALLADELADSVRAVEPASQHPAKMWVLDPSGERMTPLLDDGGADPPWHSTPYQALPPVYVQNASLEVARVRAVDEHGTIAGRVVRPLLSPGHEGFDLNAEIDWLLLEKLLDDGAARLPQIEIRPYAPPVVPAYPAATEL